MKMQDLQHISDEVFIQIITGSSCLKEAIKSIGLPYDRKENYYPIFSRIKKLNIDISHWNYRKYYDDQKILKWKETGDVGCAVQSTIRGAVRRYIYEKQNNKCAICGCDNQWNGQELHFILDHIDGDASNNCENNLRLICPNCDSQLSTYKSRNKHSARVHRK